MLNYNDFKKEVEENLRDYMPEKYRMLDINMGERLRGNTHVDYIGFKTGSADPIIYIDDMYDSYLKDGRKFDEVMEEYAGALDNAYVENPFSDLNQETLEDTKNIVFQFVNSSNQELLENLPHRRFKDMTIAYRMMLPEDQYGIVASANISNQYANKLGLDEEALYQLAKENTPRIFPADVKSMEEKIEELTGGMYIPDLSMDPQMYIITNSKGYHGAVAILYPDVLHNLSMELDGNLFLLPSSIHDFIAIKEKPGMDPDDLADMVMQVNAMEVSEEERLSNEVFYYDDNTKEIYQVTGDLENNLEEEKSAQETNYMESLKKSWKEEHPENNPSPSQGIEK